MRNTLLRIGVLLSILILVAFLIFLVNQTAQVIELAGRLHPNLADALFLLLVVVFAVCILVPVVLFFRLPRPLVPPATEGTPEFDAHLEGLRKRLRANPVVGALPLDTREEVEGALGALGDRADDMIRRTASQVFVTTAISQNGSLDAFLVLGAQSKLVWQVAHTYYQRPTIRDILFLYANVAGTAFIASELEDIDLAEQVEPLIASTLGSVGAAVPGTSLVVNSIATGAANAFLTLRVGIITKNYCGALVLPDKRGLRRSAAASAARMLATVAAEGTRKVSGAFVRASGRKVGGAVAGMGKSVTDVGKSVKDSVTDSGVWVTEKVRQPFSRRRPEDQPEPGEP